MISAVVFFFYVDLQTQTKLTSAFLSPYSSPEADLPNAGAYDKELLIKQKFWAPRETCSERGLNLWTSVSVFALPDFNKTSAKPV